MKALVTGGAGFIGSNVVRALLERGTEVRVLVLPGESTKNLEGLDVEIVWGNVLDQGGIKAAVAGCDEVYHLAAIYALWLSRPSLMRDVNVRGTRNVLAAARDAGVARVIHTSSIAVVGGAGRSTDATEESPFHLQNTGNLYATTKYEAHQVALEFADTGLDVRIVCPTGPIGPRDIGPTPTGKLMLMAINGPAAFIAETTTNFGDVRDMAEGHVLAAERGKRGEVYLVGNQNHTYEKVAKTAQRLAGIRRPILRLPHCVLLGASHVLTFWADEVTRRPPLITPSSLRISRLGLRADCSKAFTELGVPRRPLEDSLRDALHWFAEQGYVKSEKARRHLLELGPVQPLS